MRHRLSPLLRRLVRSPGPTALAVATLALGLGAATAIFTLVDGVVLRPLPYRQPDRLVGVWLTAPGIHLPLVPQSDASYLFLAKHSRTLSELGIYNQVSVNLTGDGPPERLSAARVTPSLLRVLGVGTALGRTFNEAEGKPGAEPVVLLGEGLFQRRFGGDPAIVGKTVRIDGVARQVVGVMPGTFRFPEPEVELWLPLEIDPAKVQIGNFGLLGVGRMAPGETPESVRAELSGLVRRLPEDYPEEGVTERLLKEAGFAALVHPLKDDVVGDAPRVLWILLGTVGVLLLVASANVANLFLVRAEGRHRELAVRAALGAGRRGVVSELLAESLLLALVGGALAVPLAAAVVRTVVALAPGNIPRLAEVALGGREVGVTLLLALATGLLVGALPAFRYARPDLAEALKEGGRAASGGRPRQRVRSLLVAGQMGLAVVLLAGSGLLVRSFFELERVDPGFRPQGVLTLQLSLPQADYPDAAAVASFYDRALERIRALPGVESAGAIDTRPLAGSNRSGHHFEDFPIPADALPPILYRRQVSPETFRTLGVPLREGRTFDAADVSDHRRVAVVSESVARRFFKDKSPLGHRLGPGRVDPEQMFTIVGVVGDVREEGLDKEPVETVYYPLYFPEYGDATPSAPRTVTLLVRAHVAPETLAPAVRKAVWSLDDNVPVAGVETLAAIVARSTARTSFATLLLLVGAGLALLLGAVGLYGVVSYTVAQRTREIGVRMALGARPLDVGRMVLGQGLVVALGGVAVGVAASLGITRLLAALLFGVSPRDPATLAGVTLLLVAVAALASLLPAQRAAQVAPQEALRYE